MTQRDILLRWIEQLARLVERLLHGAGSSDLALAADQVEAALAHHLGPLAPVVPRLDVETVAGLLHDPDRIFGYARLLSLYAAVQHASAEAEWRDTQDRAVALAQAALVRAKDPPPSWREWVAEAEGGRAACSGREGPT